LLQLHCPPTEIFYMPEADLPALSADTMAKLDAIYQQYAKPLVHQRW
jgi:hypothetical protein